MPTQPTNLNDEVSSLCSTGLKPLIVQGVILRLLMALFSRANNLSNPLIREYVWNSDEKLTKIYIFPLYRWGLVTLHARPAIVIKRNAFKVRQLAMGDGSTTGCDWTLDSPEIRPLGNPTLLTGIEGSTTIFVIAREPGECEAIGTEVFMHMMQYSSRIEKEFGFSRFKVAEYGGLSRLDESAEYFVIPITVAYAVIDSWQISLEAPLLKGFSLNSNMES